MKLIHALQDMDSETSLSARFRRARAAHVVALIQKTFAARGQVRIADLGGEPTYWNILFDRAFPKANKVHVTHARPLDKAQFRFLSPDARHIHERPLFLTKSLIAIRD
jgi:hypothetical protein